MLAFSSPDEVPAGFGPSAVTIGKFDGVHAGHRAVIASLVEMANERGLTSAVVTFDRNPLSLLRPEHCPLPLASIPQKLERLEQVGLDAALVLTFDKLFSQLSAEQFVSEVLVDALHARVVLVGRDFRFGAGGSGTVATLEQLAETSGFEVVVMPDVAPDGDRRVSSSWIRELLAEGRVAEASTLLGAPPTVRAEVVHGEQRGRSLGYPTANLSRESQGFVPADGVYAAWLTVDAARYPAAVSIGNNPTFEGVPDKQVEAHLLGQSLDLYGKTVELSFVQYVRGMHKFTDADALVHQMGLDARTIRDILSLDT